MEQNLQEQFKNTVKVIAFAVEKDTESLKDLLRRNGVKIENNIKKGRLQSVTIKALKESETFYNEFKNWILERSGAINLPEVKKVIQSKKAENKIGVRKNDLFTGFQVNHGVKNTESTFKNVTGSTFQSVDFPTSVFDNTSTESNPTNTPSGATLPINQTNGGFFSGLSLNGILNFAASNYNNYASVVKSNNDVKVTENLVEKERIETLGGQTGSSSEPPKSKTLTYVLIALAATAAIGAGFYFYNKQKK